MRVFRVIAIEEAFSVLGVTPPLSRDVIPLMESFSDIEQVQNEKKSFTFR